MVQILNTLAKQDNSSGRGLINPLNHFFLLRCREERLQGIFSKGAPTASVISAEKSKFFE
jgi:hypothetical protein